jgi:hypothetical protein
MKCLGHEEGIRFIRNGFPTMNYFTFSPAIYCSDAAHVSLFNLAILVCVQHYCDFNCILASFHALIGHIYIFFCAKSVQICAHLLVAANLFVG